jgi:hypothetical protein
MNVKTYQNLALRTDLSDTQYFAAAERIKDPVVAVMLITVANLYVIAGSTLDLIKRHIFYGNDLDKKQLIHNYFDCLIEHYSKDLSYDIQKINLNIDSMRRLHGLIGILGEDAEIAPYINEEIFFQNLDDLTIENIEEEAGDKAWYLFGVLCKGYQLSPEDVLAKNIAKLQARYPEKFDEEKALNRDLKAEKEAMACVERKEPYIECAYCGEPIKETGTVYNEKPVHIGCYHKCYDKGLYF